MKDLAVIEERVSNASDKNIPKAGSLQQMLIQALHTDDSVLLEKCLAVSLFSFFSFLFSIFYFLFSIFYFYFLFFFFLKTRKKIFFFLNYKVSNPTVIRKTIQRLPSPYVVPFLTQIISRFQKKPNRGSYLAIWIREILMNHTAYLTTVSIFLFFFFFFWK